MKQALITTVTAMALGCGAAAADELQLPLLPVDVTPYGDLQTDAEGRPVFRLCAGSEGLPYIRIARVIAASVDVDKVDVQVRSVGGSWTQLAALSNGDCDGVIIQPDAGVVAKRFKSGIASNILYGPQLHPEFFLAACRRGSGIDDYSDMQDDDNTVVVVGDGAAVTILGFQVEDSGYTYPDFRRAGSLREAAALVVGGQADCLATVSGLRGTAWETVNARYGPDAIRLVEATDGDFNDAEDLRGTRLYEFSEVPADTPGLDKLLAWDEGDRPDERETVMMRAVFAYRADYPDIDAADAVVKAAEEAVRDFDLANFGLR